MTTFVENKVNVEEVNKNCGIYKILSPSGRVYIGQAKDIKDRWGQYTRLDKSVIGQRKLYNSFKCYGVESHQFEIIEECLFENLSIRERFWQEFYDVVEAGLNCQYVNTDEKPRICSEETRKRMSESAKTKPPISDETRKKLGDSQRGEKNPWYGKTFSQEHKDKLSQAAKNRPPVSEETRQKNSNRHKGRVKSEEECRNISLANIGKPKHNAESRKKIGDAQRGELNKWFGKKLSQAEKDILRKSKIGGNNPQAKLVLCTITGIFYDCIVDAAKAINMNKSTLGNMLRGRCRNKTSMLFV